MITGFETSSFFGQIAHGMGRRFEINGQKQGDLPDRKIRLVAVHHMEIHVVPKLQSLPRRQGDGHETCTHR